MDSATRQRLLPIVVNALGATALGTIPLSRIPRALRVSYVAVPAGLTSAAMFLALRSRNEVSGPRRTVPVALGAPLALGGSVAGAGAAGLRIDRAIETALRARNVPAPRLIMGCATGALMAGLAALEPPHSPGDTTSSDPGELSS